MKVLVACEFSGRVRDAFIKRGHKTVSCDFLSTEIMGPHYQGNVLNILNDGWDMLIAHPPCTYLCSSGARWWKNRQSEQQQAINFVITLMNCNIDKICIENPIGILSTVVRKPDQIIHPWMFGHPESKATCLWLKNLPRLIATNTIKKDRYDNQTPSGQNKLGPSPTRWRDRSRTYCGIAEAMAEQWG